ncbi:hypothetical protein KY285_024129 [Solanum tuberosum]|nr:hypothetical protein KY289_025819 [Solanum tuberosum]KAH0676328.1 hypothetical protein KY285_024129 [Solanum tuberosum]
MVESYPRYLSLLMLETVCLHSDEPLLDTEGPRGYLTNVGGKGVDVDLGEEGETVNLGGEGEAVNLGVKGVDVNIGEEGVDDNLGRDGVDDNLGGEGESDFLSSDSDLDIPSEDGSDIDEELRAFRQERRNKKQRKKATEFEEIPVGEAGGKLGGDEDYINSSDCWSDDSDEQLDVDAVRGLDIPTRRRSKKVRTTYATTQSSQTSSICADTESVPRRPQNKVQVGTGRRLGRKKANARGTPIVTESDSSSSQLSPLSGHKRPYNSASFVVATGGNRRPATGFGVYSNPTTGAQVFNPGTSSEKILHGPTKLKSASPTNIDIGFKPRGLKWKGKDAVSTSQLQQMKANRKN